MIVAPKLKGLDPHPFIPGCDIYLIDYSEKESMTEEAKSLQMNEKIEQPTAPTPPPMPLAQQLGEWLKERNAVFVVKVQTPRGDAQVSSDNFIPTGWQIVFDVISLDK